MNQMTTELSKFPKRVSFFTLYSYGIILHAPLKKLAVHEHVLHAELRKNTLTVFLRMRALILGRRL